MIALSTPGLTWYIFLDIAMCHLQYDNNKALSLI